MPDGINLQPKDIFGTKTSTPTMTAKGTLDFLREAGEKIGKTIVPDEKKAPLPRALTALFEGRGAKEALAEAGRAVKERITTPLTTEELFIAAIGATAPLKPVGSQAVIDNFMKKVSLDASKTARRSAGEVFNDFYRRVIDRFNPIVRVTRQAEEVVGKLPAAKNPEILARRYLGIKGIAESKLGWKTWDITPEGNIQVTGESLSTILKPVQTKLNDLRALLIAEREKELLGRGIKKGIVEGEADEVLTALRDKLGNTGFDQLRSVAQETRNYAKRAILKPLRDVGAISQETHDAILKSNEFYTPFARLMEELESRGTVRNARELFQFKTDPLKRIHGSERKIIDPLESLVTNTYRVTDYVERARVSQAIVGLRNFSDDLAREIFPVKAKIAPVAVEKIEKVIDPVLSRNLRNFAQKIGVDIKDVQRVSGVEKERIAKGLGLFDEVQRAKKFGLFARDLDLIKLRFASREDTLAHEIGHAIDAKTPALKARVLQNMGELGKIATTRVEDVSKISNNFRDYLFSPDELFAEAISMYITDRSMMMGVAPQTEKILTEMFGTSRILKELITFAPSRVKEIKEFPTTIFRPSFFNPAPDTVAVLEDGQRIFYKVPKDLAELMTNLSPGESNILIKLLSFPARLLRAGATLSPEFIGRNPFRDQFTAFVQSRYGYTPGVDLVKGVFELVGRNDVYGRWLASGGAHSMFVSLDRLVVQKTLKDLVASKSQKIQTATIKSITNPIEALRIMSETMETGTRLGAFRKATRKGISDLEAGFEVREITLDFSRVGANTRALNQITAFFNARIQGIDKIARSFAERPIATSAKVIAGITIPSISLYLKNRNHPLWDDIPRWQKDLFWIVIVNDNLILRIPKPFELGIVFGTIPERILEWIDKKNPDALKTILTTVGSDFGLGSLIPTATLPLIENTTNYKFFTGRPIVGQSIEGLPEEMQSYPYTSETAKVLGEWTKQSPAKIENIFYSYTGGLGRYAVSVADQIIKIGGLSSPPPLPEQTLADIPFIRAFVVRSPIGTQSETVNQFYDLLERAESLERALKRNLELGKVEEADTLIRERKEVLLVKGLRRISRELSQLRQMQDAIFNSRDLSSKEKRAQLDDLGRLMTELADQAINFSDAVLR